MFPFAVSLPSISPPSISPYPYHSLNNIWMLMSCCPEKCLCGNFIHRLLIFFVMFSISFLFHLTVVFAARGQIHVYIYIKCSHFGMKPVNWMTYSSCFFRFVQQLWSNSLYIFFPVTVLAVIGGCWTPQGTCIKCTLMCLKEFLVIYDHWQTFDLFFLLLPWNTAPTIF